jgi:hypothetical protein
MQWSFAHAVVAVIASMWVLDGMRPQFRGSAIPGSMVDRIDDPLKSVVASIVFLLLPFAFAIGVGILRRAHWAWRGAHLLVAVDVLASIVLLIQGTESNWFIPAVIGVVMLLTLRNRQIAAAYRKP